MATVLAYFRILLAYFRAYRGVGGGEGRVGIKKPTQKNPPKKTQKTHLKNPLKMGFFGFFWVFLNCKFFMKSIQTFLFETDFLWTNK